VQRRRSEIVDVRHDDVPHERGRDSQFAGVRGQIRLRAAVGFQPTKIVRQVGGKRANRR
jgi:hypothetical protein